MSKRIEVDSKDLITILEIMNKPVWPVHQYEAAQRLQKELESQIDGH